MNVEELLDRLVQTTGPHALWLLFGAAMMEYVFPPFPGDTVTLLGAYYAVAGALSIPWVFAAVTTGSVVGSAFNYWIGIRLRAIVRGRTRLPLPLRWLSLEKIQKIENTWKRWGDLVILFNRFIPGIRSLFFVVAGIGGIRFRRVMLLGALSAALWNALLLTVGYLVGANLVELERFFKTYSFLAWTGVGLIVLLFIAQAIWRRRRARRRREEGACPH